MYSAKVMDHFQNPRNVGEMPEADALGKAGSPTCGDILRLYLKFTGGRVAKATFKTFGCGSAIASSSLATEWLKGKTLDEALQIKNTDIVETLKLPPIKIHCSVLAEDAIKQAIGDYKQKQS